MESNGPSLRYAILRMLLDHMQSRGIPLLTLNVMAREFGEPPDLVRQACDALERDGYIKGFAFGANGKQDPTYDITKHGVNVVYNIEQNPGKGSV